MTQKMNLVGRIKSAIRRKLKGKGAWGDRVYITPAKKMDFCKCDFSRPWRPDGKPEIRGGLLMCLVCGLPIQCEFCHLDGESPHAAELTHIDYQICGRHLYLAVDNVRSQEE
jgi:hypothetical protein